ncbi:MULTISPECIES: hypothetical protein [Aphanizomenonaceae]|uniref:O-antigen polymerase n=1 Tax=Dolichospermum heterosporum TAC447 TaxID=747523 RepID=A0ABY5LYX5_9CYAN|nr:MULTISPECIES: hypothetical protein [Aphanizomenonaceae]UUO16204.1 hypothetical protein NG743_03915 [Dolichospermum heterosporum TAC447]
MISQTEHNLSNSSIWKKLNWTWAHSFILLQFTLQLLLLIPQVGLLRVPIRGASFALSLFLLVRLKPEGNKHPATNPALIVMAILVLELSLHPQINSITAGLAQCAMYLAILSPLFWVRGLKITQVGFNSLMFLMWGIHTLSSCFGVLQVYFPGKFQPSLSTVIQNSIYGGDNLLITLTNGIQVYRPMGLTDSPGGAANAGFYALLFGVVIAIKYKNPILRLTGIASGGIGLFCIYLSQVRSILALSAISMVFLALVLIRTAQIARLTMMVSSVTALFIATFSWAVAIGGQSTLNRITSLFAGSAHQVYQENRGHFLQDTINNLLPKYPLGAGLGRWGMMNNYFGDNTYLESQPIWVEIQWTGWLLDGGVPLILAYVAALYLAGITAWKIAINRKLGDFALWGGLVFAYNLGAIAITFNYPIFNSQGGMELWLLNGALFVVANNTKNDNLSTT